MCRVASIILILSLITAGLTILGAIGPPVTVTEEFGWKDCEVKVNSIGSPFVSSAVCKNDQLHEVVPADRNNHVYYLTIPIKRSHRIMSRWYQYLLTDINVALKHDYIKQTHDKDTFIAYEVAIGYRDDTSSNWEVLAVGNGSRLLHCEPNDWGIVVCDHFPLFELWSVHHQHYIINLRFLWLPMVDGFPRDNSVIKDMSLIEIHQHPAFTRRWFIIKTVFFILSLFSSIYSFKKRKSSLYHRSLLMLNISLLLFNIPVEWLSLYIDTSWITLLNDIRQGYLILVIMVFWSLVINNHNVMDDGIKPVLPSLLFASLTALGFLVYDLCERGIQVFLPFYSLWGSSYGRGLIYLSVSIATLSCLLYIISLIINFIQIRKKINNKLEGVASANKSKLLHGLNIHLLLTVFTAVCSLCGYVLPADVFLLQHLHGNTDLSLYGAILFGNYGLWNCYVFIVTFLSSSTLTGYKILSTGSQEE